MDLWDTEKLVLYWMVWLVHCISFYDIILKINWFAKISFTNIFIFSKDEANFVFNEIYRPYNGDWIIWIVNSRRYNINFSFFVFTFFSFVLIQKKQKIKALTAEPKIYTQNLNLKNSPFRVIHCSGSKCTRLFLCWKLIFVLAHTVLNY